MPRKRNEMRIGRVVGNLISTVKDDGLQSYKLLIVEYLSPLTMVPEDVREIATDCVDAGVGDIVLVDCDGGACNMLLGDDTVMIDRVACAIIDSFTCYDKKTVTRHCEDGDRMNGMR